MSEETIEELAFEHASARLLQMVTPKKGKEWKEIDEFCEKNYYKLLTKTVDDKVLLRTNNYMVDTRYIFHFLDSIQCSLDELTEE